MKYTPTCSNTYTATANKWFCCCCCSTAVVVVVVVVAFILFLVPLHYWNQETQLWLLYVRCDCSQCQMYPPSIITFNHPRIHTRMLIISIMHSSIHRVKLRPFPIVNYLSYTHACELELVNWILMVCTMIELVFISVTTITSKSWSATWSATSHLSQSHPRKCTINPLTNCALILGISILYAWMDRIHIKKKSSLIPTYNIFCQNASIIIRAP